MDIEGNNEREKLLKRYLENLYTKDDAEYFFKIVKDRKCDLLIDTIICKFKDDNELKLNPDPIKHKQYTLEGRRLLESIQKRKRIRVRNLFLSISGIASIFIFLISILNYVSTSKAPLATYQEVVTSFGENRNLILSDNTNVTLNSCTNIAYPDNFGKNERRILLSGEAFFDVNKAEIPFIIETERFDIKVMGTAFNVKVYDEDEIVSITVTDGHVQVTMPEATIILKQNEKILLNTRTGEIVKEIFQNHEQSIAWINGGLYFNRTPIRDIARELERIYGCKIEFEDGEEFNNLISGEHENQCLESVLQSIEYISGIKYLIKGNEILLYK